MRATPRDRPPVAEEYVADGGWNFRPRREPGPGASFGAFTPSFSRTSVIRYYLKLDSVLLKGRGFHVARHHELVLCDRNIAEMRDVLRRKAPYALADMEVFLAELAFDLVAAPECPEKLMDDPKDQPILNAAIVSGVDIIVTGDKHFLNLSMECPCAMTPAQYIESVATGHCPLRLERPLGRFRCVPPVLRDASCVQPA